MSDLDTFIETCTNDVHPKTVAAIIELVTGGDPFVLTVITVVGERISSTASNRRDVINQATDHIWADTPVSVGLMQVSDQYWNEYDVTIMDMLEPCTNIKIGTTILKREYVKALNDVGDSDEAMRTALNEYFTKNQYADGEGYTIRLMGEASRRRDKSSWAAEMKVAGFGSSGVTSR